MASTETTAATGVTVGQPNLQKQDLSKLNVSTLTALSPEVISRQATINIGTIGHVAHGKSTVVKAISGVQTVRFKNELERNITIKLERLRFDEHGKVIVPTHLLPPAAKKRPYPFHSTLSPSSLRPRDSSTFGSHAAKVARFTGPTSSSSKHGRQSLGGKKPPPRVFEKAAIKRCPSTLEQFSERQYTVERIVDVTLFNRKLLFRVKWTNYDEKQNTWEPLAHLDNCQAVLDRYLDTRLDADAFDQIRRMLDLNDTKAEKELLGELVVASKQFSKMPDLTQSRLKLLETFLTGMPAAGERLRRTYLWCTLAMRRREQLANLAEWELVVNGDPNMHGAITVENIVDLEHAPTDFTFISEYRPHADVYIPEDPLVGCACVDGCNPRGPSCCPSLNAGKIVKYPYRGVGRVNVEQGVPIYECNRRCACARLAVNDNDVITWCRNRVVQRGSRVSMCIFRTANNRGWGLRARRIIARGEFVCEYVGEVISSEEAERRGAAYDAVGRTYLFDLDFNSSESPFTVDAARQGNVSHFINHSCEPNLGVWAVWVNCLDPNLPRLAMFALREIQRDEELTFDYMHNSTEADQQRAQAVKEGRRQECLCGASTCRRYLF